MALLSVMRDSREPSWSARLTFGGVPVVSTMLDAGDFWCATDSGELLAIERKAGSDLLNSIKDDRLFSQISRLRQITPWVYLIVAGDLRPGPGGKCWVDGRESGWNWWSIQGALLTCQELGASVVLIQSDTELEQTIMRLASRERGSVRVGAQRDATIVSESEQILAALPGIGGEKSRALLDRFDGDVSTALCWLTIPRETKAGREMAGVVEGIGIADGIARKVRRALGLGDGMYLRMDSLKEGER